MATTWTFDDHGTASAVTKRLPSKLGAIQDADAKDCVGTALEKFLDSCEANQGCQYVSSGSRNDDGTLTVGLSFTAHGAASAATTLHEGGATLESFAPKAQSTRQPHG